MTWTAANIIPNVRWDNESADFMQEDNDESLQRRSSPKKRRTVETMEAVTSRLTKSYSTAIECIGALQKANESLLLNEKNEDGAHCFKNSSNNTNIACKIDGNENSVTKNGDGRSVSNIISNDDNRSNNNTNTNIDRNRSLESLQHVATAARTSLEQAILLDPIMTTHTPALYQLMQDLAEEATDNGSLGIHSRESSTWTPNKLASISTAAVSTLPNTQTVYSDTFIGSQATKPMFTNAQEEKEIRNKNERWIMMIKQSKLRPPPPQITLSAHKSIIRKLAYLSLVNYADLLVSCCVCNNHRYERNKSCSINIYNVSNSSSEPAMKAMEKAKNIGKKSTTILDKGVVPKLKYFVRQKEKNSSVCSCWSFEDESTTYQLALVALCDASRLDSSDPTMWLKLACTARKLGGLLNKSKNVRQQEYYHNHTKYRKLEVFALESGYTALPPDVPPNRMVVRALKELNNQRMMETKSYYTLLAEDQQQQPTIPLDLTRYSWSVLGRMVMKACRNGSNYNCINQGQTPISKRRKSAIIFGSPLISLRLSPMLLLPSMSLLSICQFLENYEIQNFEATCRALSVSIMSVRALMEKREKGSIGTRKNDDIIHFISSTSNTTDAVTTTAAVATPAAMLENTTDQNNLGAYRIGEEDIVRTSSSATILGGHNKVNDDDNDNQIDILSTKMKSCIVNSHDIAHTNDSSMMGNDLHMHDANTPTESCPSKSDCDLINNNKNKSRKSSNGNDSVLSGKATPGTSATTSSLKTTTTQTHRASKRLRSQLINSGKISERNSRRKSVQYCLLASTLSCRSTDPAYIALKKQTNIEWDLFIGDITNCNISSRTINNASRIELISSSTKGVDSASRHQEEALKRMGDSSISFFLNRYNNKNSGPVDLLFKYLCHVSRNVEQVFSIDPGDAMTLTSCVIECFELVDRRCIQQRGLIPGFLYPALESSSEYHFYETNLVTLFALDLIHTELRFKRCERQSCLHVTFDSDDNFVSCMVPYLLSTIAKIEKKQSNISIHQMNEKSKSDEEALQWAKLKVRLFWLTSGFFLWRSRIAQIVSDARQAEEEGMKYIGMAIDCFKNMKNNSNGGGKKLMIVRTSHLTSPGRSGPHWKYLAVDTLSTFYDEIQASSIVSLARQQFLEKISLVTAKGAEECNSRSDEMDHKDQFLETGIAGCFLSQAEINTFSSIGNSLFVRYDVPYEISGSKHMELVHDFLSIHGNELLSKPLQQKRTMKAEITKTKEESPISKLDKLLPFCVVDKEHLVELSEFPSILTILITCLQFKPENNLRIIQLLCRLILTTRDQYENTVQSVVNRQGLNRNVLSGSKDPIYNSSDSEDDEDNSNDDDSSTNNGSSNRNIDGKTLQYGRFMKFLLGKLYDVLSKDVLTTSSISCNETIKLNFSNSDECIELIHVCFKFSSEWYQAFGCRTTILDELLDLEIFRSTKSIFSLICSQITPPDLRSSRWKDIHKIYLYGLMRMFISQRSIFTLIFGKVQAGTATVGNNARESRSVRQRRYFGRAKFLAEVLCELGDFLSRNLGLEYLLAIKRSHLFDELNSKASEIESPRLEGFCENLLWFWNYISSKSKIDPSTGTVGKAFDRRMCEYLRVPLATVICGFSGSATCTRDKQGEYSNTTSASYQKNEDAADPTKMNDQLCLTDFLDSDASAIEYLSNSEDESKSSIKLAELVRAICHAVYSVGLVFGDVEENEATSFDCTENYATEYGPLLPLVVVRVLNYFSDILLVRFNTEEGDKESLWSNQYPFATRSIGNLIDSNLYKAYKCIHGFTLVGTNDTGLSSTAVNDSTTYRNKPESAKCAAQLYRCITRAYSNARKSPPKSALECVSSALPPIKEHKKSEHIRGFLFGAKKEYFTIQNVVTLVTKSSQWDEHFSGNNWDWIQDSKEREHDLRSCRTDNFIDRVQKGICAQLAKGQIPSPSSDSTGEEEERAYASRNEEELSKKFQVILDNLCYNDSSCSAEWFRAAQCLIFKAELIADRLGLSEGSFRCKDFKFPGTNWRPKQKIAIAELEEKQDSEACLKKNSWIPYFGTNLSLYTRHNWSSFSSLECCAKEVSEYVQTKVSTEGLNFHCRTWNDVAALYEKEDYIRWQVAWGGIFVSALRKMAVRCLCLAIFLAHKYRQIGPSKAVLLSEIYEALGTMFYSGISGSQNYGYPNYVMTESQRRDLAKGSKICFQYAAEVVGSKSENENEDSRETWDLLFMIGKCHEKIAGSYTEENFILSMDPKTNITLRKYEYHMRQALGQYATALEQAEEVERNGGMLEKAGGSSHGSIELLYRLHSSRLKCLLVGVSAQEDYREIAETEGLRLAEVHWYGSTPENPDDTIRDRVWNVLSDVVSALVQCRLKQPFFHRSVYRHAQALLWAPLLCDPVGGRKEESTGTIPATRSYRLRGLNYSTDAASSSLAIIFTLFEKRRAHLCAVWITTTGSNSPFQSLNSSIRKYDSLRSKYVAAYTENLRLCRRKVELESLLRWIMSCKRDLPAAFNASACVKGGPVRKSHNREPLISKKMSPAQLCFLTSAKRHANSALADVLIHEMSTRSSPESDLIYLKLAYACFLRLHCGLDEIKKMRTYKYGPGFRELDALRLAFLKVNKGEKIKFDCNNWSCSAKDTILDTALIKCKELFPTVSSSCFSKKMGKKNLTKGLIGEPEESKKITKRKNPGSPDKASFEVPVPQGLTEEETFVATVKVKGKLKKVKLKVPPGNPSSLRFSLNIETTTQKSEAKRPHTTDS